MSVRRFCCWCALLHCSVGGTGVVVSGRRQRPLVRSLVPVSNSSLFLEIITRSTVNVATQPESHNLPMEISELWVRPGMIWASLDGVGSCA